MKKRAQVFAVAIALTVPASAHAQGAGSRPGYENVPGATQTGFAAPAAAHSTAPGGSLPFTGLDVVIAALVGAGLVGCGVAVRRQA